MKVKRLRRGGLGRPCVEVMPDIRARLEDHCARLRLSFAFQIVLEEWKLHVRAEVLAGLGVELHIAQVGAVAARPAAMHPGAFHQRGGRLRIEFPDRVIGPERAAEILGVKPSAHHQHGAMHILHVPREVARLPVTVVGVVLDLVVEEPVRSLQIEFVEVGEVARLQIELVAVRRAEVEGNPRLGAEWILLRMKVGA